MIAYNNNNNNNLLIVVEVIVWGTSSYDGNLDVDFIK